jgi:hypothetical protein
VFKIKVLKISAVIDFEKQLTPPNLPIGEEKSPFGGFRGSKNLYQ